MDESDLFPGFDRPEDRRQEDGKKRRRAKRPATPQASPPPPTPACAAGSASIPMQGVSSAEAAHEAAGGPAASVAPVAPARLLTHADLGAPTLDHLAECPALAETASAVVERCLAERSRFPHTLLVGPADSSKRLVAQAIAADMAAPFHVVEMLHIGGPDALHAALRGVPAGAVVLVSGVDTVTPNALADLARAVAGRESVRDTTLRDLMREVEDEPWKKPGRARAPRGYQDFTVVMTSRTHVPSDSPLHRWVQLQFFTQRNAHTEAARMARAFRRAGVRMETESMCELARFAVTFKVRTLQAVNAVLLHGAGHERLEPRSYERIFEHAMDPEQVRKLRRFLRRAAA